STLAIGHSEVLTGSHIVTQGELDAGAALVNTASVTDAQHDSGSSSVSTLVDQDPDWAIVKTAKTTDNDGDKGVIDHPGQVIFYEVKIINDGNSAIHNVVANDPMGNGVLSLTGGDNGNGVLDVGET